MNRLVPFFDRLALLLAASVLLVALLAAGCGGATTSASQGDGESTIGSLSFPTSGSPEAQEHFLRGAAILHSFGYKQAIAEFQKAQEIDPDFAMAYWGESFCYNHPLLSERDLDSPREVLERLGESSEERLAKAPTKREKGFLRAAEALWFGEGDTAARRIAYLEEMERLYKAFPEDHEVAAFYSLALLSAIGPLGDDTYRLAVKAGAIALEIFDQNPDHPGAAHYVIHSFDDPIHAPLALPAAFRFAEIAPAVSHARHMPSHIFIQRGMWDRVSRSNDSAYQAAVDLWQPDDSVADMVHALDWGQYGDLQRADVDHAKRRMALLDEVVEKSDGANRATSTVPLMWSRFVVETEQWEVREVDDETSATEALGIGISAVELGDLDTARRAERRLAELAARERDDRSTFARGDKPDKIRHREVAALIALAEGRAERATALLAEGVELAASMGPPRGSATPVKPVHELYGEVLLELGRPAEAAEQFAASLLRTPNRPRSLLGLARARQASGDTSDAAEAYRELLAVWGEHEDMPEVVEARSFLAESET